MTDSERLRIAANFKEVYDLSPHQQQGTNMSLPYTAPNFNPYQEEGASEVPKTNLDTEFLRFMPVRHRKLQEYKDAYDDAIRYNLIIQQDIVEQEKLLLQLQSRLVTGKVRAIKAETQYKEKYQFWYGPQGLDYCQNYVLRTVKPIMVDLLIKHERSLDWYAKLASKRFIARADTTDREYNDGQLVPEEEA